MINVLAELERFGIPYEWGGESEVMVCCPFHGDKNPSLSVNVEKEVFQCHTAGCKKSGDVITLLAKFMNTTRSLVIEELSKYYALANEKIVDPSLVEEYHQKIWKALPLLKALRDRAVTDEDIRKYRLGEHKGRIIIPIKSASGHYINLKKYLPGAPGNLKMKSQRGRGKQVWYPIEQLSYDKIVLVGGEIKAIAAARILNAKGYGAISTTGGEDGITKEMADSLIGRSVWVINDIDEAGQKGAISRCNLLKKRVNFLANILLPLDPAQFPTGDVNDFLAIGGDLLKVIEEAQEYKAQLAVDDFSSSEPPESVAFIDSVNARYAGKRIGVRSSVVAMDTAPYSIPKSGVVVCDQDQKFCVGCRVYQTSDPTFEVPAESPAILQMTGAKSTQQREALKTIIGIPEICRACTFNVDTYYNVEDVRLSSELEISNRNSDRVMQPAYCIGERLELNETYEMEGRMHPHPLTQQATLLISKYNPAQDALSTFKLEDHEALKVFQPEEWTLDSLKAKLDDIYGDLEANVTRIFQRREIHLAVDLTYHSPLFVNFDGRVIKGWAETLIMGDSSQGKTDTVIHLMNHYSLGEKVECKNATVAGLLGGLQQSGNRWFATWGVIPTHDRRLVVLEELKGASTFVIGKLTEMRSSGMAEIPKIEKRKTHARTRLLALSNQRSDRPLHEYSFGVEAILELIGSLEDVRRFDLFVLVSSTQVKADTLNILQRSRPEVEHKFTRELCRRLILWSWTCPTAIIEPEATQAILDASTYFSDMFTDAIPVFDRGSGRYRLTRLAAALAARTFSIENDTVYVRKCHVDYIREFIEAQYTSPVFGYHEFTRAAKMNDAISDTSAVRKAIEASPFPKDLIESLIQANKIDLQDIQDWCAWDRYEAQQFLSLLVRKHALTREKRAYRKTSPFIHLLKEMQYDDSVKNRPEFIPEEF